MPRVSGTLQITKLGATLRVYLQKKKEVVEQQLDVRFGGGSTEPFMSWLHHDSDLVVFRFNEHSSKSALK